MLRMVHRGTRYLTGGQFKVGVAVAEINQVLGCLEPWAVEQRKESLEGRLLC